MKAFSLYYADTVEDVMQEILSMKRALGEAAVQGMNNENIKEVSLLEALEKSPKSS